MSCLMDCCGVSDNRKDIIITDQNKIIKGNRRNPNKEDNTSLRSNNNDEEDKKQKELDISDVLNCFFAIKVPYKIANKLELCLEIIRAVKLEGKNDEDFVITDDYQLDDLLSKLKIGWEKLGSIISNNDVKNNNNINIDKNRRKEYLEWLNRNNNEEFSNNPKKFYEECTKQLNNIISSIVRCKKIAEQIVNFDTKQDGNATKLTTKVLMDILIKNCLSLEDNTELLLDVLKNGYIGNDGKRKFLNIYQISLLVVYNKNIAKRIIDDNLSIILSGVCPYKAILIAQRELKNSANDTNNIKNDNDNLKQQEQEEILKDFLSNLTISDINSIKISNRTLGMFQLEDICLSNKDDSDLDYNRFWHVTDQFCDSNVKKVDLIILNNNTIGCSNMVFSCCGKMIGLPTFKCISKENGKNSAKLLNVVKDYNFKSNDNIDNQIKELSFVVSSAGVTNMIYELEEFAKTNGDNNNNNVFITTISIRNFPIDISTITMDGVEAANRLINVLYKLINKGFITKDKKLTIEMAVPDEKFVHNVCYSQTFLKCMMEKIQNKEIYDNNINLSDYINFSLVHQIQDNETYIKEDVFLIKDKQNSNITNIVHSGNYNALYDLAKTQNEKLKKRF